MNKVVEYCLSQWQASVTIGTDYFIKVFIYFFNNYGRRLLKINEQVIQRHETDAHGQTVFHLYPVILARMETMFLGCNLLVVNQGSVNDVTFSLKITDLRQPVKVYIQNVDLHLSLSKKLQDTVYLSATDQITEQITSEDVKTIYSEIQEMLKRTIAHLELEIQHVKVQLAEEMFIEIDEFTLTSTYSPTETGDWLSMYNCKCESISITGGTHKTLIQGIHYTTTELTIQSIHLDMGSLHHLPDIHLLTNNDSPNDMDLTIIIQHIEITAQHTFLQDKPLKIHLHHGQIDLIDINCHCQTIGSFALPSVSFKGKNIILHSMIHLTLLSMASLSSLIHLGREHHKFISSKIHFLEPEPSNTRIHNPQINVNIPSYAPIVLACKSIRVTDKCIISQLSCQWDPINLSCASVIVDKDIYFNDTSLLYLEMKGRVQKIQVNTKEHLTHIHASSGIITNPLLLPDMVKQIISLFPTSGEPKESPNMYSLELDDIHFSLHKWNLDLHMQVDHVVYQITFRTMIDLKCDLFLEDNLIANLIVDHVSPERASISKCYLFADTNIINQLLMACNSLMGGKVIIPETIIDLENLQDALNESFIDGYVAEQEPVTPTFASEPLEIIEDYQSQLLEEKQKKQYKIHITSIVLSLFQASDNKAFMSLVLKNIVVLRTPNGSDYKYNVRIADGAVLDLLSSRHWKLFMQKEGEETFLRLHVTTQPDAYQLRIILAPLKLNIKEEALHRLQGFFQECYNWVEQESYEPLLRAFEVSDIQLKVNFYPKVVKQTPSPEMLTLKDYKILLPEQSYRNVDSTEKLMELLTQAWMPVIDPDNYVQFLPHLKVAKPITLKVKMFLKGIKRIFM